MKNVLTILGYSWAVLCIILIPATFIGNSGFAGMLAKSGFMKVNPVYSGGDIDHVLDRIDYKIQINKPVFAALIGESSRGFVQVKWIAAKELSGMISDTIDIDANGKPDFFVCIETVSGKTEFEAIDKNIIGLRVSSRVKDNWIIRVDLRNPKKQESGNMK